MVMTPLQKQLKAASFRGVPFKVEEADYSGGRRTVVHEYPQRDDPYAEDLGRAYRSFAVQGFVVGADYIDQANKLIAALEAEGAATLVHPWLGTLQVKLQERFRVHYSAKGLGLATFEMVFVEAGDQKFPEASASTQAESRIAADGVQAAALTSFVGDFKTKGVPDFVSSASIDHWQVVTNFLKSPLPGTAALGYANKMADFVMAFESTAADPAVLGSRLISALGITQLANTVQRWQAIIPGLLRMVSSGRLSPPASSSNATASRRQAVTNTTASSALTRRVLLTQAVGASSVMPVAMYDEAIGIRNTLADALDSESLLADDATYRALQAARAAVWADLTARSRNAARIKTYTPVEVVPAIVLAHRLYGDATRADEIIARNGIRHPDFVQARPLKVLTS